DEYKFTDWYERYSDIDEQGDFKKTFDYDGSRFGHDTSWDIQIEFNGPAIYSTDGSCTLVIKIYNTEKFSLVKNEQQGKVDSTENGKEIKEETETETTGNPFDDALITLPDPEDYFDDIAEVTIEKDGEEIIYTVISDSDTKEATDTYVELMEKVVDMKLKGSSRLGGYGYTYTYFYSGDDEHFDKSQPAVQIKYESNYDESLNGKYRSVVTLYQSDLIYASKGVSFKADEAVENTPTSTPTPTPTPEPAAGPEVLPNFTKIAEKYDGELNRRSDENYILYYFGDSIPKTPIDDYIEALEAKGYKVTDSEISGNRHYDLYEWWLTNSAVDAIDIHGDHKGQVYVRFNDGGSYSELTIEFSNGISMEGYKDEPYPSVDPDDFWEDCPSCINGVCSNCGGSGKDSKFQAGLGWVEQDCLSCIDGDCKYCGGSGYLGH
ncbi:MAG: zinc finger-like domain-containing protein, partial [Clostridia bacterium]|nr:zinc finger-like domain-containing protein [Clostridia bacterium]